MVTEMVDLTPATEMEGAAAIEMLAAAMVSDVITFKLDFIATVLKLFFNN